MTEAAPLSFDLRTQPWLLARFPDGRVRELSLLDTFARAHEIMDLIGEVPTQSFALYRLLLAILYRSLPPVDNPILAWKQLWDGAELPGEWIEDYLGEHAHRFDLLHPQTPFYQVADLHTHKGDVFGLERLIADVPNGHQFFTTRRAAGLEAISFAEAARWLMHAQAFDPAGIKSGAIGDGRVKDGKGHPHGPAWAGQLGGILLEGESLKQTLLLNLVLGETADTARRDADSAVWERPAQTAAVEDTDDRVPQGPVDLLTWQSRRIRLAHDGECVTGVLIANGDALRPQNRHTVEHMTAWRRSEAQEKKPGEKLVYMPRTHNPERSFWRGLAALIPQATRAQMTADGAAALAPGTVHWVRTLRNHGAIDADFPLRTHALGIRYGTQSSTVVEIIDDVLDMDLVLVLEEGVRLAAAAEDTVAATEKAINAVAFLAANLAVAAGGYPEGARERARERAYFLVDPRFRSWLARLRSSSDPETVRIAWNEETYRLLRELGKEVIAGAGPAAWIGRERTVGGHVSSAEAFVWFERALSAALPRPAEMEGPKVEEAS